MHILAGRLLVRQEITIKRMVAKMRRPSQLMMYTQVGELLPVLYLERHHRRSTGIQSAPLATEPDERGDPRHGHNAVCPLCFILQWTVGSSPMGYLIRYLMSLAEKRGRGPARQSRPWLRWGYKSESAYKRHWGARHSKLSALVGPQLATQCFQRL